KPGKPTILAVTQGRPLIGLPGYPTSALMIFNLIVAPIIRRMAGLPESGETPLIDAKVAVKIFSAKGRRELLPVQLISSKEGYSVYPVGFGSGAISSMALADGFIDIPKNQEFLEEDEEVKVKLFSSELRPADLIIIGSHCTGIDLLLQHMRAHKPNLTFKVVNTGSFGGFKAVERGEADIAGVHLLDEDTGEYNTPFLQRFNLKGRVRLIRGYRREQGLIVAKGNPKGIRGLEDILRKDVTFINRNRGSGTRVLTDIRLKSMADEKKITFENMKKGITGYDIEAKSHSAVAAAVAQGRADVGLAIKTVAHFYNLDFIHIVDERYDFLTPADRSDKESVKLFIDTLVTREFQKDLQKKMPGLKATSETGMVLADTNQNL
ncbi:MAG: substrate-binding domain-containing protein, partial [Nitrososphaerales archaeon]